MFRGDPQLVEKLRTRAFLCLEIDLASNRLESNRNVPAYSKGPAHVHFSGDPDLQERELDPQQVGDHSYGRVLAGRESGAQEIAGRRGIVQATDRSVNAHGDDRAAPIHRLDHRVERVGVVG